MSKLQGSLRAGVAAFVLAIGVGCVVSPALAQGNITLPAASLQNSLNKLSRQSGAQILYDLALLRGKKAPSTKAAPSIEAALTQLLRGSGLAWQKRGDAFLIVRASAVSRPASDERAENRLTAANAQVMPLDEAYPTETNETIVVTGSHIPRPELDNPMPVNVVDMDTYLKIGVTHPYDALQYDPAITPGTGLQNTYGSASDSGIQTVSLRGFGTGRTLTLVDGRRRVPGSSGTAAVDLNMISPAMIERIEVVTGGAAAIYGADAVSGVVNVVTRDSVKGLHIDVTNGISKYGDAARTTVSVATGGKFDDGRGSFAIGGTWSKTDPFYSGDRPFSRDRILFQANPKNTGAADGISDTIMIKDFRQIFVGAQPNFYEAATDRVLMVDPIANVVRAPIGGTRITTGTTAFWSGGEGGQLEDKRMLQTELEALTVSAKVKYDITDAITYRARFDYGQTSYMSSTSVFRQDFRANTMNNYGGDVAYLDNPYLPSSLRDYMLGRNLTKLSISRAYYNFPAMETLHAYQSFTVDQQLEGKLTDRLNWNAFFQYGRTTDDLSITNTPMASRYIKSRDVIADPVSGKPVCRDTAARAAGCQPLNIFSQDTLSDAQKAWLLTTRTMEYEITQKIVGANVSGTAFPLPYGDVSIAAGVERRVETVDRTDDPRAASGDVSYFGLIGQIPDLKAKMSVTEAFGELIVPVLRDLPFANRLEIEGAYRYSFYDNTSAGPIPGKPARPGSLSRVSSCGAFARAVSALPISENFTGRRRRPRAAARPIRAWAYPIISPPPAPQTARPWALTRHCRTTSSGRWSFPAAIRN
ncbi:MAG: TonB-dependent receptor plug domain-containing protein [Sphingomonadales bacterium]|nr:TonB-dependent receptor plug domain-containing protein [Sphingomonadales bacterium]